jgi:4-nitrophenyl phosphatase
LDARGIYNDFVQSSASHRLDEFAFAQIEHLLIDIDGVLYRGRDAVPTAIPFIPWLRQKGISFRLVTNNATLTPASYESKLAGMGIKVREEEIFTSSLATAMYLDRQGARGQSAFVVGEDGVTTALSGLDMKFTAENPRWVIVGLDRTLTYEKLALASLALQRGARFVGTNPDTSFPDERGLVPGAGAIQALLTATTGIHPTVIGKPHPLMLSLAMEAMEGTAVNTAMLGDRLDTDIQGANALQMPSILVLTGVSRREEIDPSGISPTLVVDTLEELVRIWP